MTAPHPRLAAARLRAVRQAPYLAAALFAMVPVEKPGIGTMAVDMWWRVYYDPAILDAWSIEEIAGVLLHEVAHLLRRHHARMRHYPHQVANLATDAEINDDLLREGVVLPGTPVTPAALGLPEGRLAEEYVEELLRREQGQQPAPGQAAGDEESGDAGDAEDQDASAASSAACSSSSDSPRRPVERAGGAAGSCEAAGADDTAPRGGGGRPVDSGTAAESAGGAASQDSGGGASDEEDTTGESSGSSSQWRSGSCATGHPDPWEDPAPSEGGIGVTEAEAEAIRRRVAEEIVRSAGSQLRGTIPGGWRRWAEGVLAPPRIPWQRVLAGAVRSALRTRSGAADYTYRRPNRRAAAYDPAIMPALRQPDLEVAVILDTSGSMSDAALRAALAEVLGVVRAQGREVTLITCDAAVQVRRRVRTVDQARAALIGGGGTDLRRGFEAANRLRPDLVVVLTDCETPWPDRPPRYPVIVARLGRGQAPDWARVIDVETDEKGGRDR